jgi:hypothetical protein
MLFEEGFIVASELVSDVTASHTELRRYTNQFKTIT